MFKVLDLKIEKEKYFKNTYTFDKARRKLKKEKKKKRRKYLLSGCQFRPYIYKTHSKCLFF